MRKRKDSFFIQVLLIMLFFTACSCRIPTAEESSTLTLMTWNVQNLFDAVADGGEYTEFDPGKSGWNDDLVKIRLENISRVILSVNDEGPDIILLQEVENTSLLERLNREYLGDAYAFCGVAAYTENSIHCGFLSRVELTGQHILQPGEYGGFPLRAIQELRFRAQGEELVVLNNHWKSRSGGVAATESGRVSSARMISRRIGELKEEGLVQIIVAGDLNGSAADFRKGGIQTAQIPVGAFYDSSWMDSLYIATDPEDLTGSENKVILFSPWEEIEGEGSYFFQNRWMMLDHFLVTDAFFDGEGWELDGAACLNESPFCSEQGKPLKWESWKGRGLSDHFPLVLHLRRDA